MSISLTEADAPRVDVTRKEFRELLEAYLRENWTGEGKARRGAIAAAVFALGLVASALGAFVVLVPVTYQLGGLALHSSHGWKFWQPGVGGRRFVALNAVSWTMYSVSLLMSTVNVALGDFLLSVAAFAVGMVAYGTIVSSLLVYRNSNTSAKEPTPSVIPTGVAVPTDSQMMEDRTFNDQFELSMLMHNGEGPSDLWWLFVSMNTVLCAVGAWVGVVGDFHAKHEFLKILATSVVIGSVAVSTAITHAIGGQWRHIKTGYLAFQPGKGGPRFVAMQALGWTVFSTAMLLALIAFGGQVQRFLGLGRTIPPGLPLTTLAGTLGFASQVIISVSLFFFVATPEEIAAAITQPQPQSVSLVSKFMEATHYCGFNLIFNAGSTYESTRTPTISSYDAWEEGERRFKRICDEAKSEKTGYSYLVIGVGFVGRRLVQRLLDRGETKIRLFDIMPHNPFEGNPLVEYVRGDVTKYDSVLKACEGVQIVYSTFAIIRFMDRLEHQAALSYRINVGGTENVLKACAACNVEQVIVTSSSHATTDEHSEPRLNRDESAPYVVRETAHNHYGWTKAAADIMCLKSNGMPRADGQPLRVSIVRPCSGVFGGDDRISFEKAMDLGVFPGLGAKSVMDWVYVENVVLGHLLCEAAMNNRGAVYGKDPAGEAFNVSNNEAVKVEDFWFSVVKIVRNCVDPKKRKSNIAFIFIPEAPLWAIGYISELNQKIFKGKVSLGRDIDMLSPGMLATATMHYSYNSDKAKAWLGYEPAYTVDEAIQKSAYDYWAAKYPDNAGKKTQ